MAKNEEIVPWRGYVTKAIVHKYGTANQCQGSVIGAHGRVTEESHMEMQQNHAHKARAKENTCGCAITRGFTATTQPCDIAYMYPFKRLVQRACGVYSKPQGQLQDRGTQTTSSACATMHSTSTQKVHCGTMSGANPNQTVTQRTTLTQSATRPPDRGHGNTPGGRTAPRDSQARTARAGERPRAPVPVTMMPSRLAALRIVHGTRPAGSGI